MEEYLGIIKLFAGNFAPVGYLECNGQLLSIAQNSALFSIIGVTYGGDGISTFALPDLRGRVAAGRSNTLPLGAMVGAANATATGQGQLSVANLPAHSHTASAVMNVNNAGGTSSDPTGNLIGSSGPATDKEFNSSPATGTMHPGAVSVTVDSTGNGVPFPVQSNVNVMQPTLALTYIICAQGIYPSRP